MLRFVSVLLLMILEVLSLGATGSKSKICKIKCENSVCETICSTSKLNVSVESNCNSNPFCLYDFCFGYSGQEDCPCRSPLKCFPDCKINSECPPQLACINKKCVYPCPSTCGRNATCNVVDHIPSCHCEEGFEGDPFVSCHSKKSTIGSTSKRCDTICENSICDTNCSTTSNEYKVILSEESDDVPTSAIQNPRATRVTDASLDNDYIFCLIDKKRGQLVHSQSMLRQDKPFKFIVELEPSVRNDIPTRIMCLNVYKVNEVFINTALNHAPGDDQYVYTTEIDTAVYTMTAKWFCKLYFRDLYIAYLMDIIVRNPVSSTPESSSLMTILIIGCSVTLIVILIISAIIVWRKMEWRLPEMDHDDNIYEEVNYTAHPAGASSESAPRPACPLPEGTESREYVYDIVYESRVRRLWEARWFAHKRSERAEEIRRLAAGVPRPRV